MSKSLSESNIERLMAAIEGFDARAVSVDAARALIAQISLPVSETETIALDHAVDRILAGDVYSPIDVPAHDNAAMDGYSLQSADLNPSQATQLRIIGEALAGRPFAGCPMRGEAVRIMTGALMPQGHDTVVMQEVCQSDGVFVTIPAAQQSGQNRRTQGEDLARGAIALRAGTRLEPAALGLLASLGVPKIEVRRRVRVALFSTGDELRSPGEALGRGQIYDSNRYTLRGLLQRLDVDVIDLGRVPDQPDALESVMREAAVRADMIVSSAGVSAGEADHTRTTIARLGDVSSWALAIRPGRPLAIGRIGSALYFGLPGNPVAAMVTFIVLVREAVLRRAGATLRPLPFIQAHALEPIRKRPGRTEYLRGVLSPSGDGRVNVRTTGDQGSGILRSMAEADCLIVMAAEQSSAATGDLLHCFPMSALINP